MAINLDQFKLKTLVKQEKNTGTLKIYGVSFTCLNARVIHTKPSSDLSIDLFILSLNRFYTQRIHINIFQSENGTNFIGAVKEINDADIKYGKTTTYLNKRNIKWYFNHLPNPLMGGC